VGEPNWYDMSAQDESVRTEVAAPVLSPLASDLARWATAVVQADLAPEVTSYNGAAIGAGDSEKGVHAPGLLTVKQKAVLVPNVSTYLSAINAIDKKEQTPGLRWPVSVPNDSTYDAAISDHDHSEQGHQALRLQAVTQKPVLVSNDISYNIAISTSDHKQVMQQTDLVSNVSTYNTAISASDKSEQDPGFLRVAQKLDSVPNDSTNVAAIKAGDNAACHQR
jgi:hypothetical protein